MNDNLGPAANSANSQPNGRKRTTQTSKRTVAQELEILTQAFHNVEEAGVKLELVDASTHGIEGSAVVVVINMVALQDGLLVPLEKVPL